MMEQKELRDIWNMNMSDRIVYFKTMKDFNT